MLSHPKLVRIFRGLELYIEVWASARDHLCSETQMISLTIVLTNCGWEIVDVALVPGVPFANEASWFAALGF